MEINIKKKKKPVWPWIVALLVVLAIIFILYTQFGDEVEQQINNNDQDDTSLVEPKDDALLEVYKPNEDIAYYDEVKDFINYIEQNNIEEDTQQDYTENATVFLALALSKMVDLEHTGDAQIEARRDELMLAIQTLNDSTSGQQTDMVGLIFTQAAELMTAMQKKDYPALQPQVYNVEKIARSISPNRLSAEQRSNVKEFFLVSKVALKAISEMDTF